jgi:hypothetical protein
MELISICDGEQSLHAGAVALDVFVEVSHLVGLFVRRWVR